MRPAVRYLLAILLTVVALLVVRFLHPVLDGTSYVVFVAAVALAAGFLGLGPALVATAVSVLAIDFFFMPPVRSLSLLLRTDALALSVLSLVAVVVSGVVDVLRRRGEAARGDARKAANLLGFFQRYSAQLEGEVDARRGGGDGRRGNDSERGPRGS